MKVRIVSDIKKEDNILLPEFKTLQCPSGGVVFSLTALKKLLEIGSKAQEIYFLLIQQVSNDLELLYSKRKRNKYTEVLAAETSSSVRQNLSRKEVKSLYQVKLNHATKTALCDSLNKPISIGTLSNIITKLVKADLLFKLRDSSSTYFLNPLYFQVTRYSAYSNYTTVIMEYFLEKAFKEHPEVSDNDYSNYKRAVLRKKRRVSALIEKRKKVQNKVYRITLNKQQLKLSAKRRRSIQPPN